jgi:hypothetical protein
VLVDWNVDVLHTLIIELQCNFISASGTKYSIWTHGNIRLDKRDVPVSGIIWTGPKSKNNLFFMIFQSIMSFAWIHEKLEHFLWLYFVFRHINSYKISSGLVTFNMAATPEVGWHSGTLFTHEWSFCPSLVPVVLKQAREKSGCSTRLGPTIACKNNETLHILVIFLTCVPPSPH